MGRKLPQKPINRGLLFEPIVFNKDGVFGSERSFVGKGPILRPDGQWDGYELLHEHQAKNGVDTMSCVTWGFHNQLEFYMYFWLGLVVNYADRFLAKASGTTEQGNSPQKVYETARNGGVVLEEVWPWTDDVKSWADYMVEIPRMIFIKAKEWLFEYDLWHDYVPTNALAIREALKYSPVAVSVGFNHVDANGAWYKDGNWPDGHWALVIGYHKNGDWKLFDTYPPFIKRVRADFVPDVAKVIAVTKRVKGASFVQEWVSWALGILQGIAKDLSQIVPPPAYEQDPRELPMNQDEPKLSRILEWALAIQNAEGGKPQDLNTKLHNPGAMKYTPYTASLGGKKGPKGSDGGFFCTFDTYKQGFEALCTFLRDACSDILKDYRSTTTLDQFTKTYANVPLGHNYQKSVATRLGVPLTIKIRELL